jgi:hypothetical protein
MPRQVRAMSCDCQAECVEVETKIRQIVTNAFVLQTRTNSSTFGPSYIAT